MWRALVMMLLAGCTVGPDWQQPKVETPPAWRIDYEQAAELANARWWQAFGDPGLDRLAEHYPRANRAPGPPPAADTRRCRGGGAGRPVPRRVAHRGHGFFSAVRLPGGGEPQPHAGAHLHR